MLAKWLAEKPEVRVAILSAKDHPFKDVVASYYPQEAREAKSEDSKPNLNDRLASVADKPVEGKPEETDERKGAALKVAPKNELAHC